MAAEIPDRHRHAAAFLCPLNLESCDISLYRSAQCAMAKCHRSIVSESIVRHGSAAVSALVGMCGQDHIGHAVGDWPLFGSPFRHHAFHLVSISPGSSSFPEHG